MVIKKEVKDKHEWKKTEKHFYQPKAKPEIIEVPTLKFFVISGKCNPNSSEFAGYIEALYAASYTVRMSHKGAEVPEGFYEYTVYPLEGVWGLSEAGIKQLVENPDLPITALKDELTFDLMIRQPDFLTPTLAERFLKEALAKKKTALLSEVRYEEISDGKCIQMLHEGAYDDEPASFSRMEAYCVEQGFERVGKLHREIYITDARKTAPEKQRTVLRFPIRSATT